MAVSKANQRAVNKYVKNNYDRINVTMPKGKKDTIQAHAEAHSESVNGFINRAIDQAMEQDGSRTPSKIAQQAQEGPSRAGMVSLPSEVVETAQRAAEAVKEPVPLDKVKTVEKLVGILGDLDTVDLDKARSERLGIVYLSPDTLEAAQHSAEVAGEELSDFVARAIVTQVQRDQSSLRLGINPATGGKLGKE